jgi:hypothetical protein
VGFRLETESSHEPNAVPLGIDGGRTTIGEDAIGAAFVSELRCFSFSRFLECFKCNESHGHMCDRLMTYEFDRDGLGVEEIRACDRVQ